MSIAKVLIISLMHVEERGADEHSRTEETLNKHVIIIFFKIIRPVWDVSSSVIGVVFQ
jgi:hypothetical protein